MPTALQLGRTGWQVYIRSHVRRPEPLKQVDVDSQAELLSKARDIARRIKRELGASRVILFGSLAHRGWHDSHSDVDLAVEGLGGATYWEAWRIAEDTIRDRQVDIIEIENANAFLLDAIEKDGIPL